MWAWTHAGPTVLSASRVIFEVVPTNTKKSPVINFVNSLMRAYPEGQVISLDCPAFLVKTRQRYVTYLMPMMQKGVHERPDL